MTSATRIRTDIDFDKDGKQVSWIGLPHSVTRSAYGKIMIPLTVIKNGRGPTALFMAGNHGDEFEGQIALCKLIREIESSDIAGRIIIAPAINLPAALASSRVSPIDGGNMNRLFPGDPDGTLTEQIAYYVDSVLYPMADHVHDLHSGGSSLHYIPYAYFHQPDDPQLHRKCQDAMDAFAPPLGVIWRTPIDTRLADRAAHKRGIVALGGEFGGQGSVSIEALGIVERGLKNTLSHLGIIAPTVDKDQNAVATRMMEVPDQSFYCFSPEDGLFEPRTQLGDLVQTGDLCGYVHFVDDPGRAPAPTYFGASGMVVCKRHFARVELGDCVAHLAVDLNS